MVGERGRTPFLLGFRSRSYEDLSFPLLIRKKADTNSPVRLELATYGGPVGMGVES